MPKTLNELAGDLKQLIIDLQSDAHNNGNIRMERYNNLKLLMFPQKNRTPHVIVDLSMSAAEFDIQSGQKINGSLGPDERYVLKQELFLTSKKLGKPRLKKVEKMMIFNKFCTKK